MKCSIYNTICKTRFLCCHFCDNKKCEWRCLDTREGCKYAVEGEYSYEKECEEIKFKQSRLSRMAAEEAARQKTIRKPKKKGWEEVK